MADLFLDPRLSDYYVERDWRSIERDDAGRDQIVADFLEERIAIIHGLDIDRIDFDLLETVKFPQTWAMKKFQFQALIDQAKAGGSGALYNEVLQSSFKGDRGRVEAFVEQLTIIDGIATRVIDRVLGHLQLSNMIKVVRFCETRMEALHNDIDPSSDDHEAFRFYINLDAYPRIWATSYTISELMREGGQKLCAGIDPEWPAEMILKRAITRAYGGWNQRATERKAPRHQVYFDPGDVWIVDGRSVSHQVMSGHRVLSVYVKIPHAGNPQLTPTFAQKIRSGLAEGLQRPVGSETAIVNYFMPQDITSASNVKEDWATVFGETRTGRLRRFDDTGLALAG